MPESNSNSNYQRAIFDRMFRRAAEISDIPAEQPENVADSEPEPSIEPADESITFRDLRPMLSVTADENSTDGIIICSDCEKECAAGQHMQDAGGKEYCAECAVLCEYCGVGFPSSANESMVEVGNRSYCEACTANQLGQCVDCGDRVLNGNSYTYDSNSYCGVCYTERFAACDNCGYTHPTESMYYDEHSDRDICEDCRSAESHDGNLLAYDYRPEPEFFKCSGEQTDLYFGIEIEAESHGNCINDAIATLPDFTYAKRDGSLDDGMEVVTHPLSWSWIKKHKKEFDPIFALSKSGFRSHDTSTCGIHVHISKQAFGTMHLYKFLQFFYSNPNFILIVSQRLLRNLNEYATVIEDDEDISYKVKKGQSKLRFTAVNLQNRDTVEIRIFKGTLNSNSFWKNIEFVKAAFEYTKATNSSDIHILDFILYVNNNRKEYPNLSIFLREKKDVLNYLQTGQ